MADHPDGYGADACLKQGPMMHVGTRAFTRDCRRARRRGCCRCSRRLLHTAAQLRGGACEVPNQGRAADSCKTLIPHLGL